MNKDHQQAYEAIAKINNEMVVKAGYPYEDIPIISMNIVPTNNIVKYNYMSIEVNVGTTSIEIFNSHDDDRIYYEEKDTYESWYKFIRRKWKAIRESFYDITL